ncbi:serine/threonine-protein kinase haspin homolog [Cajanus cajan]|uniref:serine/threonine-protein kinase haspin homolog n=1 Tax=Cajanus cajan TaxID=3821 RepID=UPI0010FB523E|nr:serine/threonine-protein kinase haspin homolog [Cajanus cajan]
MKFLNLHPPSPHPVPRTPHPRSPHPQQIGIVYSRRNPRNHPNQQPSDPTLPCPTRVSLADPNKRVSWNRSLSTRGRTSIAVGACMVYQPGLKKDKRKPKPPLPKVCYLFYWKGVWGAGNEGAGNGGAGKGV